MIDGPTENTFYLYFNPSESIFIEEEDTVKHKDTEISQDPDDPFHLSYVINHNSQIHYSIYTDLTNSKILISDAIFEDGQYNPVLVKDETNFNWEIFNEFKDIGNFHCQKARTDFRGRTYTAWFTNEIPVRSGPWKFNSLPGIILEVYDDKSEVHFSAQSITIPYKDELEQLPQIKIKGKELISLKEFVDRTDRLMDEIYSLMVTKLPRNAEVSIESVSIPAIELEYDF